MFVIFDISCTILKFRNTVLYFPEFVRETRAKKYTKLSGTFHVVKNESFLPIPVENLENVHKLRFTRARPNESASDRTIDLIKSPILRAHGRVPMPACKVQTVKKETRGNLLDIVN